MIKLSSYFLMLLFLVSCSNSTITKEQAINIKDSARSLPGNANVAENKTAHDSGNVNQENATTVNNEDNIQKAVVSKSDSSIWLTANIKLDHRIFGYNKPDTASTKMILLSIFTDDVKGNPFKCPFGAYYQTSDMPDMELKYIGMENEFVKANILKNDSVQATVYIDKKWIELEE